MHYVKIIIAGFLGILISSVMGFVAYELFTYENLNTSIGVPIDAVLIKEYRTYDKPIKLWKLDGMCFVSYDFGSSRTSLTYVPCPTQEKEKP